LDKKRPFLSYTPASLPDWQHRIALDRSATFGYRLLAGETEVGSAGEQPTKG
jgi:hypothetical protein